MLHPSAKRDDAALEAEGGGGVRVCESTNALVIVIVVIAVTLADVSLATAVVSAVGGSGRRLCDTAALLMTPNFGINGAAREAPCCCLLSSTVATDAAQRRGCVR